MHGLGLEQQVIEGQGKKRLDLCAGPVVADIVLEPGYGTPGSSS